MSCFVADVLMSTRMGSATRDQLAILEGEEKPPHFLGCQLYKNHLSIHPLKNGK